MDDIVIEEINKLEIERISYFQDQKQENSFDEVCSEFGLKYKKLIESISGNTPALIDSNLLTNNINIFQRLKEIINFFKNGKVKTAITSFEQLLIITQDIKYSSVFLLNHFVQMDPEDYLFRSRTFADLNDHKKEEGAHIKFSDRGIVLPQRFNFIGHPCLYFTDSIYIGWEEIGRVSFDSLYSSVFKHKVSSMMSTSWGLKINPYNYSLKNLRKNKDNIGKIISLIKFWPLHFFCLYKIYQSDTSRIFKEEYIISQLISNYFLENEQFFVTNGLPRNRFFIEYFSTKIKIDIKLFNDEGIERGLFNFFLPTNQKNSNDSHDEILKEFDWGPPISYALYNNSKTTHTPVSKPKTDFTINLGNMKYSYSESKLYKFELFLIDQFII